MMQFQLVVVIFLLSIDRVLAPMTKKRSKLRNRNSTSDPENVSPRGSRSPSYREIPCRDSSSIVINRVSSGFDGYIFGSLSRPPENCSVLLPRCNFVGLVQFLKSLSKHIASRYLCVDDAVVIWRFSDCKCARREMVIWLENVQRNLEYGIVDGWLVMLLEYLVFIFRTYVHLVLRECNKNCLILIYDFCKFTRFRFFVKASILWCGVVHDLYTVSESCFRHQNPLRQGENFKFAVVICCLDLYGDDCYNFLELELLVYEVYVKTLMSFGGLRMITPLYDSSLAGFYASKIAAMVQLISLFVTQEACCFEVLMSFVVERLLQFHSCVEAHMRQMKQSSPLFTVLKQFHSYVSAHMRLMEQRSPSTDVMEVVLLSCLPKVNSFSSKWLDLHVIIGSQSCVSRHKKIWSRLATLIHEAVCIFAGKGACFMQELFDWLKCFLFVVIGCSITEIHSDVVFALCARPELLMTQSLLQPLFHWFKSSKRLASGSVLEFGSRLQKLQQLMSCGCPRHVDTLTGLLFQLLASRVKILYISFGDPLILLMHMMQRVVIVGCGRVQIFAAEVFALNATHELMLSQSLPQLCLQGQNIDFGIFGLKILDHSFPRLHDVFMSKMRIPSHLEGEY
ncbi:unnamed protein product [Arabidopsis halleri]